jgi:hypothetical protein
MQPNVLYAAANKENKYLKIFNYIHEDVYLPLSWQTDVFFISIEIKNVNKHCLQELWQ